MEKCVMANITPEEDRRDLAERLEHGHRLSGSTCVSNVNANACNRIHGTNLYNDATLKRYEENSETISRLRRQW